MSFKIIARKRFNENDDEIKGVLKSIEKLTNVL